MMTPTEAMDVNHHVVFWEKFFFMGYESRKFLRDLNGVAILLMRGIGERQLQRL